ncbi:hypothetical protein ACVDG3_20230 [Meridianimarinicoccus sp. RP-17]|uniref:hypothetical protein n=1 Tax=Meridianimarinicoccus zhengii TaxID=2056810 RepID=UPI001F236768|nr:hypothetical protein [Phycocomes zhengii]
MDFPNLVTTLHERLDVDIPEADYPQIATVALAEAYLVDRVGRTAAEACVDDRQCAAGRMPCKL